MASGRHDSRSSCISAGMYPVGTKLPVKEFTCVRGCGREPWRGHDLVKQCPQCYGPIVSVTVTATVVKE
jgi:hypothetical protein